MPLSPAECANAVQPQTQCRYGTQWHRDHTPQAHLTLRLDFAAGDARDARDTRDTRDASDAANGDNTGRGLSLALNPPLSADEAADGPDAMLFCFDLEHIQERRPLKKGGQTGNGARYGLSGVCKMQKDLRVWADIAIVGSSLSWRWTTGAQAVPIACDSAMKQRVGRARRLQTKGFWAGVEWGRYAGQGSPAGEPLSAL
ncbi:hypothetical protein GGI07_004740 [Coemansia sp. Benny D115]|nr:hypothetical protein GGI07_004740 [Coemansia sp. Benny D115]